MIFPNFAPQVRRLTVSAKDVEAALRAWGSREPVTLYFREDPVTGFRLTREPGEDPTAWSAVEVTPGEKDFGALAQRLLKDEQIRAGRS